MMVVEVVVVVMMMMMMMMTMQHLHGWLVLVRAEIYFSMTTAAGEGAEMEYGTVIASSSSGSNRD